MKKIIWYWNVIHYNIFKFERFSQRVINYPVILLTKIEPISDFLAKMGNKNPRKNLEKYTLSKDYSSSSILANIHMGGILVLLELSLFCLMQVFIGKSLIQYIWENSIIKVLFLLLLIAIPGFFNYFTLFRNEKYLSYFKQIDKLSKIIKKRYAWFTILFLSLVLIVFIASLYFAIKTFSSEY